MNNKGLGIQAKQAEVIVQRIQFDANWWDLAGKIAVGATWGGPVRGLGLLARLAKPTSVL